MNDSNGLFHIIESTFSQLTPSEKRIGSWLLSHREHIPFETADSIAQATGTSGITVGRYLRKLGYRNLDDVKHSLKEPASTPYRQWGVIDRLDSWSQQQAQPDRASLSLQMELDATINWRRNRPSPASVNASPRPTRLSSLAFSRPAASPTRSSAIWNTCARV